MDLGLAGKKAIITGGTKGIGRRIAEVLLAEGCDIAICSRDPANVSEAADALSAGGGRVLAGACDISNKEEYEAWLEAMVADLGGVDIFVPNVSAGPQPPGEDGWRANFETDVMGCVRGCEVIVPHMAGGGGGAITVIGTTAASETFMAPLAYNALKASLITYAKQLGQETGKDGIRINVVSPGPVYFEGGPWHRIEQANKDFFDASLAAHPSGRLGKPEEVARCVAFLSSPAASWVTGVNLTVDGGYTKRVQF